MSKFSYTHSEAGPPTEGWGVRICLNKPQVSIMEGDHGHEARYNIARDLVKFQELLSAKYNTPVHCNVWDRTDLSYGSTQRVLEKAKAICRMFSHSAKYL